MAAIKLREARIKVSDVHSGNPGELFAGRGNKKVGAINDVISDATKGATTFSLRGFEDKVPKPNTCRFHSVF
ncbi:MAG: hypothetical protein DKT66_22755 [Candidatus Melainabacteria bacterium]|nr:MAG: hypothetical protein DKT66_22755 [Candidatus Melainabacteria bacterium]